MKITKTQLKQIVKEELNEVERYITSGGNLASTGKEPPQWAQDMMAGLTELIMRTNRRLNDLDKRLKTFEGTSE